MRARVLAVFILFLCGFCAAQKLHFSPVEKADILQRIRNTPQDDQERLAQLKAWFAEAGCNGNSLKEQSVNGSITPNLICRLPGQRAETIIVGAHYDHTSSAQRPIDNWSGAALLPSLFQCIQARKRHHTIIFVAFADRGNDLRGAERYANHLSPEEVGHVQAMINLDVLGLSPTKVWTAHSDKELVHSLVVTMYAMKLPASQIDIAKAGNTDSEPFALRKIPQITIHSLTQQNLLGGVPSPFRPENYYDTYRLLCGYLAYLDESSKSRPHSE